MKLCYWDPSLSLGPTFHTSGKCASFDFWWNRISSQNVCKLSRYQILYLGNLVSMDYFYEIPRFTVLISSNNIVYL